MPSTPSVAPVAIHVIAIQFTPGHEPVHIHYQAAELKDGPLAQDHICHTTQTALMERSVVSDTWGDAEADAELVDHLAGHGIAATIRRPSPVAGSAESP